MKKVDDIKQYLEDNNIEMRVAKKFGKISAYRANKLNKFTMMPIQTKLDSGFNETEERTPEEGDYICKNENSGEQWIMKPDVFERKYERANDLVALDIMGSMQYKPKGKPMLAGQVTEDITFCPPNWGGDIQNLQAGGYLLQDMENKNDIYGIEQDAFNRTYKFV